MKTSQLKTFTLKNTLSAALFTAVVFSGTVQAENWEDTLYEIIHPESADLFHSSNYNKSAQPQEQEGIFSLNDDYDKSTVWSYEFEEYVNLADFQRPELANADDVNQYMGSNPTAAGDGTHQVFFYNEAAGEYHLQ